MCNLNFVWRKTGMTGEDLHMLDVVTYKSYVNNSDGEGVVYPSTGDADVKVVKSRQKLFVANTLKDLAGKKWAVFHERLATHGTKDLTNVQPIASKRFVLAHNGVLHVAAKEGRSDTAQFVERFTNLTGNKDTAVNHFVEMVAKMDGSKSIFWYDKKTSKLHYYKNASTCMYIVRGKGFVFASTSRTNCEYVKKYTDSKGKIRDVRDNIVFEVQPSGDWLDVARVPTPPAIVTLPATGWSGYGSAGFWSKATKWDDKNPDPDAFPFYDEAEKKYACNVCLDLSPNCAFCGKNAKDFDEVED